MNRDAGSLRALTEGRSFCGDEFGGMASRLQPFQD